MLHRRDFLKTSTLLAVSPLVPGFVARTARAAEHGKDTILVLIEMTGGNDGLNMIVPYGDDAYQRARPTLGLKKHEVLPVDHYLGLHPALGGLRQQLQNDALALVQGIGYPNPDRSHFESMDRWQAGEVTAKVSGTGWLARSVPFLAQGEGVPVMHVGSEKLPLACRGTNQGVFTLNQDQPFELKLGVPGSAQEKARKRLLADVAGASSSDDALLPFVQRRHLQTYMSVEKLKEVLKATNPGDSGNGANFYGSPPNSLSGKMALITSLIEKGFGTRVFYTAIDGFDTHSNQSETHKALFQQLGDSVNQLFTRLTQTGDHKRVLVMTFSEFGRRVYENGSRGTDHGAGSCLFVTGPAVKAGPVGKHPSLTDLDEGDVRHHTDFRRVYATILDRWLGCDSKTVLNGRFEHIDLLKKS